MINLMKWLNFRTTAEKHAEYRNALEQAAQQCGRHVFGSEVIVPGIDAFIAAVKNGKAKEYLAQK